MTRSPILLGLVLALAVAPAPAVADHCHDEHGSGDMGPPPELEGVVKGEFSLTDVKTGEAATQRSYDGRIRLVFFGFTHCTVVCPTGLMLMSDLVKELESQDIEIVPIFITIDPKRDTAERLAGYLQNFDERIVGLRGGDDATRAAMKSFRIEAPKIEVKSETDYQFDHPTLIMLMDREGRYVKSIPSSGAADELAKQLVQAMAEG